MQHSLNRKEQTKVEEEVLQRTHEPAERELNKQIAALPASFQQVVFPQPHAGGKCRPAPAAKAHDFVILIVKALRFQTQI